MVRSYEHCLGCGMCIEPYPTQTTRLVLDGRKEILPDVRLLT